MSQTWRASTARRPIPSAAGPDGSVVGPAPGVAGLPPQISQQEAYGNRVAGCCLPATGAGSQQFDDRPVLGGPDAVAGLAVTPDPTGLWQVLANGRSAPSGTTPRASTCTTSRTGRCCWT